MKVENTIKISSSCNKSFGVNTKKDLVPRYRFTKFHNLYYVEDLLSTKKYELSAGTGTNLAVMIPARMTYEKYCQRYAVAYGQDLGVHKLETFCDIFLNGVEPFVVG